MGSKLYLLACALHGVVLVCWTVVEGLHAEGEMNSYESASSTSLYTSLPRALHSVRPYQREDQEQGKHANEERRQEGKASSPSIPCIPPSSCDYTPAFMQQPADPAADVGCFPHEGDIGSRTANFQEMVTNTLKDCMARCRASNKCQHFTWNKNSRKCHLKSEPPQFYTYKGDITGPRSCDTTCYLGCLTYNTNPMKTLNWGNNVAGLCQAACWSTRGCLAFVLDNGKCKLFGSGFSAYRAVSGGKTIAGPREYCENKIDLRIVELLDGHSIGSCLKGDNVGTRNPNIATKVTPDVATCQHECANNPRCGHYTYNTRSQSCSMKDDSPQKYYHFLEDMTGDKTCEP